MKRSEAIETIAKAKNAAYGINWEDLEYPSQLIDLQVAAYILHMLEEVGMTPPPISLTMGDAFGLDPEDSEFNILSRIKENKWETEDEESK